MKRTILSVIAIVLLVGISSCSKIPEEKVTIAFDKWSAANENTATRLQSAKSDKEVADILIAHAEDIKMSAAIIHSLRIKYKDGLDENQAYKLGKLKAENSGKKLNAELIEIAEKYKNSDELLTAYGKMESIIKEAQTSAGK
ncbi:MAG TPA: hypothetical protein PKK43_04805 [Spirochaetota bacterium]|nr:hypothetical protein [Spirochaetota bacterium]